MSSIKRPEPLTERVDLAPRDGHGQLKPFILAPTSRTGS